ncbi:hypothetical protein B484DRAFT_403703 [Ochromonadaceae sp. CCMP2298]|nr:hypothetical protein B484DRAFT_403703 [Ochromonadaceae sp. CCMP2298]
MRAQIRQRGHASQRARFRTFLTQSQLVEEKENWENEADVINEMTPPTSQEDLHVTLTQAEPTTTHEGQPTTPEPTVDQATHEPMEDFLGLTGQDGGSPHEPAHEDRPIAGLMMESQVLRDFMEAMSPETEVREFGTPADELTAAIEESELEDAVAIELEQAALNDLIVSREPVGDWGHMDGPLARDWPRFKVNFFSGPRYQTVVNHCCVHHETTHKSPTFENFAESIETYFELEHKTGIKTSTLYTRFSALKKWWEMTGCGKLGRQLPLTSALCDGIICPATSLSVTRSLYNMSSADDQNTGETANNRINEQGTPASPGPNLPPFTQAAPGPETFVPTEEQRLRHEQDALQQTKMSTLLGHIQAFRQGPEIEGWDAEAYEMLTRIPGLALGPLTTMLSHGAAVKDQLKDFEILQADLADQLKTATAERDSLRMSALIDKRIAAVSAARVQDTPGSGGFALHSNFGAHGPEGPHSAMSATSATSGTVVASVQIQGHTKHLSNPLTSNMARSFRTWALGERREGRNVHLPALIALAAQKTISGRFHMLSDQRGFCPEFPEGASSASDKAKLKILAANPATWWLGWPLPTFLDSLIRAFPSERAGAYSTTKTLEELLGEVTLAVNVSDFAPLSKYIGAIHEACELASPREEGNEKACVKALHAGFSMKDTDSVSKQFRIQLDIVFGGSLPPDIDTYILAVDREYHRAVTAETTSKAAAVAAAMAAAMAAVVAAMAAVVAAVMVAEGAVAMPPRSSAPAAVAPTRLVAAKATGKDTSKWEKPKCIPGKPDEQEKAAPREHAVA